MKYRKVLLIEDINNFLARILYRLTDSLIGLLRRMRFVFCMCLFMRIMVAWGDLENTYSMVIPSFKILKYGLLKFCVSPTFLVYTIFWNLRFRKYFVSEQILEKLLYLFYNYLV